MPAARGAQLAVRNEDELRVYTTRFDEVYTKTQSMGHARKAAATAVKNYRKKVKREESTDE